MHLKRKIYQELLKWKKDSNGESAMLIKGARRVGKSYLCKQFGENEYESMIFIDFSNVRKDVIGFFENETHNLDLFFSLLSTFYKTPLHTRNSLFVFDEVQKYPKARQLIKHLVADGRYDYIETGSLISIKKNVQDIIIPSEEEKLEMFPLDFEEFLWAMNDVTTYPYIKSRFEEMKPVGQGLHRNIMSDFRQYVLIGGMPQAVVAYAEKKDFASADRAKKRILDLYRDDITRYATGYESKVTDIFETIPGQLSKKEKRFKLSAINKDARFREYDDAFMWLADGMVANPSFNATDPNIGLALSADHSKHKLYMADTGLLVTHTFSDKNYMDNDLYRAILLDKLYINEGMIMENIVAQMLRSNGHRLFFYSRVNAANRSNMMQIDFLISRNNRICPIEVKSSSYRAHSSLDKFRRKFTRKLGDSYILYPKDVMVKDGVVHLPLYMAMFL